MKIEILRPADREAWAACRGRDITASVAAGLLGVHPYSTPYQLWAGKTGRMPEHSRRETKAMRRGTLLEPVAVAVMQEDNPHWFFDYRNDFAYYRAPDFRVGATPDVFAVRPDMDGQGIVQIKTVSADAFRKNWTDPDTGDVIPPLWIAVQTIVEAVLTRSEWACVGAMIWDRDALDVHLIDIPIKMRVWDRVIQQTRIFWEMVDAGEEPLPNWNTDGATILDVYSETISERVDLSGIEGIDEILARYIHLGEVIRDAKAERDLIKPQVIYALANAGGGETDRFRIDAPSTYRAEHVVKESHSRALRVKEKRQ